MAPIDKATLRNGDQFTNGTIGEGVLTIGICLCILDMCEKSYGNIEIEPLSVSAIAVSAMIAIMSGCDCFGSDHIETSHY